MILVFKIVFSELEKLDDFKTEARQAFDVGIIVL